MLRVHFYEKNFRKQLLKMFSLVYILVHLRLIQTDVLLKTDRNILEMEQQNMTLIVTSWATTATLCWTSCPIAREKDALKVASFNTVNRTCSCYWTRKPLEITSLRFRKRQSTFMYECWYFSCQPN